MKIPMDLVSVSPFEAAGDMLSLAFPYLITAAVVIVAAILIIKAVKNKK